MCKIISLISHMFYMSYLTFLRNKWMDGWMDGWMDVTAFSNRIVDRWNSLFECCVTCNSINCFKSHISSKLEPETT